MFLREQKIRTTIQIQFHLNEQKRLPMVIQKKRNEIGAFNAHLSLIATGQADDIVTKICAPCSSSYSTNAYNELINVRVLFNCLICKYSNDLSNISDSSTSNIQISAKKPLLSHRYATVEYRGFLNFN